MNKSNDIIGASFGPPDKETTFSGVPLYLFRAMSRRGRILSSITTRDIHFLDVLRGAIDFSKIKKYGRPGMKISWYWKPETINKLSKRFNYRLLKFPGCKVVLQIGTHVRISNPEIKHFCFTDMTIVQAMNSPFCDDFSAGILNENKIKEAIEVQKSIFENTDGIFVNSNWAKSSIVDDYGISQNKVHVVGVGASLDFDEEIDFENKKKNIIFIGRHWEHKGGPLLIEAFKIVKNKINDVTLTIIGCSPDIKTEGVEVLGTLDKKKSNDMWIFAQAIRKASVLCVPSKYEAYGICFLESQLYGAVPITFSGEGRSDAIKNGITGFIIEERSSEAIAETIIKLLSNEGMLREMGSAGHHYVKNNLTWDRIAIRVLNVIDSK